MNTMPTSLEKIREFFIHQNKFVVTFTGYSGSGYEDEEKMLETADQILREFDPAQTLINIGATSVGIGAVYKLAKQLGFTTTGIVSIQAQKYNAVLSPYVDHIFFVDDATWGGFHGKQDALSPTSAAVTDNSDLVVGIGGGRITRDELIAAEKLGKKVQFIQADMNHSLAIQNAMEKGLAKPTDFRGEAGIFFLELKSTTRVCRSPH